MIIRLGAMGDVVRTLPSLAAIRAAYPHAHIAWLVEEGAQGVLREHGDLDEVIRFPRVELTAALQKFQLREVSRIFFQFVRELRARKFDLVLDFHSIAKSGVLAFLSGAKQRVGYAAPYGREVSWLFSNHRVQVSSSASSSPSNSSKTSRYHRNQALVEYLGVDPCVEGQPLVASNAARSRVALAMGQKTSVILIHPGTSHGASYKRYPAQNYGALARKLKGETGIECLVTRGVGSEERGLADEIVAASNGAARLAPETNELGDLVALIEAARIFIGSDSGPLHIASLVGTPAVQILGPTNPVENTPRDGSEWERVHVPVACSPCRRGCAQATCMKIIPHELVAQAAVALLEKTKAQIERPTKPASAPAARLVQAVQPWA
ncbi:MAG: heptosyltransferase-1 [Myxococcota bacterium]